MEFFPSLKGFWMCFFSRSVSFPDSRSGLFKMNAASSENDDYKTVSVKTTIQIFQP